MINQTGANWKAGGELNALHRIMPPVIDDAEPEEESLPPKTHNGPPGAVFEVSTEDIELEAQAFVVEKAMAGHATAVEMAESKMIVVGRELLRLKAIFLERGAGLQKKAIELRARGLKLSEISATLGIPATTVSEWTRGKRPADHANGRAGRLFTVWAATRFGKSHSSITNYLMFGRDRTRHAKLVVLGRKAREGRRALIELVKAEAAQKTTPAVFKKAFIALPMPARRETLLWACSTLVGSEDPQEIARWFAEALARR